MTEPTVSSRRSRLALVALGIAALSMTLPSLAHADGNHHDKRHRNHSRHYNQSDDGHYGPPPAYFWGARPWRGPKRVKVYNHYYPVPVPVAVPVYPAYPQAYPQDYDAYDSRPVIRIGVDWVFGF